MGNGTDVAAAHAISLVRHRPHPGLSGVVAGMVGLSERATGPVERRQPAGSLLPLVLSFGEPLEIVGLSEGSGGGRSYGSFVSGFTAGHASTRFERGQDCVQVYLTPTGAGRLLGVPGHDLAGSVIALDDLLPGLGAGLSERLASLVSWESRFALVERALLGLADTASEPISWVDGMWRTIVEHGGQVRIAEVISATGWSHRNAAAVFTREVGLTPKAAADVVRFEQAARDLAHLPAADVAHRHGYTDQSHLTRAVRRHAGETPREHAAATRPTPRSALGP